MLTVLTANSQAGGFTIANSLRFRASASAYLNRTPASAGNRQTWTWSGWVKRGTLGTDQYVFGVRNGISDTNSFNLAFFSDNTFVVSSNNTPIPYLVTSQLFRDPSAWYHIVVAVDTTQATSTNRIKVYVNGAQITSFSTATYPSQNANLGINQAYQHVIGAWYNGSSYVAPFDGYLTEINFIDGQALTPSSFGETSSTTGVWKAKRYTGTYGTNGFRLNFSNGTSTTTLGYDSSGNGNSWTTNNISLTAGSTYDWMLDSPTPFAGSSYGVGNYAVLNPVVTSTGAFSITNGNLDFSGSGYGSFGANASIFVSSGKWYWEMTANAKATTDALTFGIYGLGAQSWNGGTNSYIYRSDGYKRGNGTSSAYGASYTAADIIGVALDLDAGTMTFYKNNSSQGAAFTGLSGSFSPSSSADQGAGTTSGTANFGQRPFAYTPPSGYKSLCTQNLPGVTIQNGAQYMAATTYTGTGSSVSISNAVNGVGFQPDFVWTKGRSVAYAHGLWDSVRGATKKLSSNNTNAELTESGLTAFGSSGFTLGSDAGANQSAATYVGWQWKAGGTAVTNTDGTITSTVSANQTAGFSVVTYTGNGNLSATVGHGLSVVPAMIIDKGRSDGTYSWRVYHQSITAGNMLLLNSTSAAITINSDGGISSVGASTFGFAGGTPAVNATSTTYVAYCFAGIPGYSAFGSYTGNGSTDGPFIFTGFRPRYVMIKRTDTSGGSWVLHDSSRDNYNSSSNIELYAEATSAEAANGRGPDLLSNGFKQRNNTFDYNASSGTYIYAAFAENPFQNALAR